MNKSVFIYNDKKFTNPIKKIIAFNEIDFFKSLKEIEEPLGSSDLSRSNWCPGTDVAPKVISLDGISAGKHTLSIDIPNAQPSVGEKMNHWLVSAYLVWEE